MKKIFFVVVSFLFLLLFLFISPAKNSTFAAVCETAALPGSRCMPVCSAPISGATGCTAPEVCCGAGCVGTGFACGTDAGDATCCNSSDSCQSGICKSNIPGTGVDLGQFSAGCGNGLNTVWTLDCVFPIIITAISWLLVFSGVVAVIFIIVSGIKLIVSGGDAKQIEGARKTLIFAIAGLVLIFLSFAILGFIAQITGVACINPLSDFTFTTCDTSFSDN